MNQRKKSDRGSMLIGAIILALIIGGVVLGLARTLHYNSKQTMYFNNLTKLQRLAESGLNASISQLIRDPDIEDFDTTPQTIAGLDGRYQSTVQIRAKPINPCYYILTSATMTLQGVTYRTFLHSYVRVSNAASYFMACKSKLTISKGADAAGGRIYAPSIEFQLNPAITQKTKVLCAEFVMDMIPPMLNITIPNDTANDNWLPAYKSEIEISNLCHPNLCPLKLTDDILFPQIFSSDLEDWKQKAGMLHVSYGTVNFTGDIYPPGYYGNPIPGGDQDNAHHIYYVEGDINIQGTVHGQILFVATGTINVTGDLIKSTDPTFPGQGCGPAYVSSSTAHQAVLITPNNIVVKGETDIAGVHYTTSSIPGSVVTQTLQALIMAPNAKLDIEPRAGKSKMAIDFRGSMIISEPPRFPDAFAAGRVYSYDNTFATNPPPYMPALAEIYHVIEDTDVLGMNY